ncbi:3-hydroxyacyl-CoA dehydrogenase NAD-binding domain-containing protein [Persicirhabdus sediminis]|uniref:enoyl-CoA hydratase n=1 Tax=Persicirhabdus sediminis TaxID=454144 RepID=A0A8J7MCZ9_9BACT|nr:3-hydroxyacyl-CoA dehydrogenase NAD-binding domain-containing protein [Persicirhabdus sediminis]MBK1790306.1 enoyl-CoA hydratase/isomerase family protein [Persicirhabdus sediminis]
MKYIQRSNIGEIAVLSFDRPGASANLFDGAVLQELEVHVSAIESDPLVRGLLIRSAKEKIFIAGADIKTLAGASEQELLVLLQMGQNVFQRIENLKIPTVAAIHGACAGGGCEIALACDWRIASDASCTRIGLPETLLGIVPAWGGSTRLPKLIGLPQALQLVLAGKLLKSKAAKAKGLVDEVCAAENLFQYSLSFMAKKKPQRKNHWLTNNPLSAMLIGSKAKSMMMAKSRGHYPALKESIKLLVKAPNVSSRQSLAMERKAFVSLLQRPETRRLTELFFSNEAARKLKPNDHRARMVERTAVIGAGVMGSGISYWLSTRGKSVLLQDVNNEALASGMAGISKTYKQALKKRVVSKWQMQAGMDRIQPMSEPVSLQRCGLVIEAATENLELKRKIFADLSERSGPETVLASNTSALPIHQLADVVHRPERLLGLHFFNPVPMMKLVEVVVTEQTDEVSVATAVKFVQSIGKLPVVVKDSPGFLVNRILMPYMLEAAHWYERGVDIETLDRVMLDYGMPMGPIHLMDVVGIDVGQYVANTLVEAYPERMQMPELLQQLLEMNMLGQKSGCGFYLYKGKKKVGVNPQLVGQVKPQQAPKDLAEQLARKMSEEAALCLAQGVVSSASVLDFAMVMGTGYAPFRGGPLRASDDFAWADEKFYKEE